MQCRICGAPLPTGAANCPNCGATTPYSQPTGGYHPTQIAGTSAPPSTNYGTPPPPPSTNPSYPYGGTSPYDSSPYDSTAGSSPYSGGTTYPQYQYPAPSPTPGFPQMPQPPKKNNTPIIITSVAVAAVLVIALFVFLVPRLGQGGQTQSTPTAVIVNTPVPTPTAQHSGPKASEIVFHAQTASEIDKDTATPTKLASTFKVGDTVYVTCELNLTNVSKKNGTYGYVQAKFYIGTVTDSVKITIDQDYTSAYFYKEYTRATTNAKAELYWCYKSDCSDAELAQTVTFKVEAA